jgi:L-asparaginase / beta-aspartyl-peptidase
MLRIVCHGGAGPRGPKFQDKNATVRRAADRGMQLLRDGGTSVQAVVAAVSFMEDDPLLNAGTGSYVQLDGQVRMDASVMDEQLNVGSVIGIQNVKNPIQIAERLLGQPIHSVLSGELAKEFARDEGFPVYDPRTDEKLQIWFELRRQYIHQSRLDMMRQFAVDRGKADSLGTVGAVAMDSDGRLAAATSTGGLKRDLPGRVGDVPLIGCGTYANAFGAVSCTGMGEFIIKVCLAKSVVDFVRNGHPAAEACSLAMRELADVGGVAGAICIDRAGRIGYHYNTEGMTFCELSLD